MLGSKWNSNWAFKKYSNSIKNWLKNARKNKKQLEDQKKNLDEIIKKGENNPNLDKEVVKLYNLKEGSAEYNAVLNLREIADKLADQGLGLDLKSFSGVKLALQIKKDTGQYR